jgi:transcriptional regulator with XRE-family HTH domain
MPSKFNLQTVAPREQLLALGQQIKHHRKANKLSAEAVAIAAGLSRTTLHRIELGEPSVAAGAYWAAVAALGLKCGIVEFCNTETKPIPEKIDLNLYPQLKLLAWHVHGAESLTARQAWDIYARNWRHIDEAKIAASEQELIEQLRTNFEPSLKGKA